MSRVATGLWSHAFPERSTDGFDLERAKLVAAFDDFRVRSEGIVSRIAASFPELTVHDATHLDALWETADLICGPGYPLNPMEAFVFGGSVLLHDAALCLEAYGGVEALRETVAWKDTFAFEKNRTPSLSDDELFRRADFASVRQLHASQAEVLATQAWKDPSSGESRYLIGNDSLRGRYGELIGKIAASHHWAIERVTEELPNQYNAPSEYPATWRIDPVKVALMLRVADASHLDDRRAPDFLFALLRRGGVSYDHWKAQNWLARLDLDQSDSNQETLLVTSNRDFGPGDAGAWWVAFDAVSLAARELSASNNVLRERPQAQVSPPFRAKSFAGATKPELFAKHVHTRGWLPRSVELHVGNVAHLVRTLGGESLYGNQADPLLIPVRELIQNARDSIAARRLVDRGYEGRIVIRTFDLDDTYSRLVVEDNGIGMSERVLTGPLLDFGTSFWASELVKDEFPGLASSGFRSSGKYGVGFYSVFMVADRVAVTSRRWESGLDGSLQVQFPDGLSLRPMVTAERPSYYSMSSSTTVALDIKKSKHPVVEVSMTHGNNLQFSVPLHEGIKTLCAALDVPVNYRHGDGREETIHSGKIPEDSESAYGWLRSISHAAFRTENLEPVLREAASRLRKIERDGWVIANAAINIGPVRSEHYAGVSSIDGLASFFAGSGGYLGFMDHAAISAKRDASRPRATAAELQSWVDEQVDLILGLNLDPFALVSLCYTIAEFALVPRKIAKMLFYIGDNIDIFTADQTIDLMMKTPIAFFLSSHMPIIETYLEEKRYKNFPTILPITNGNYNSTALEEERGAKERSFLYVLRESARARGMDIEYVETGDVIKNILGVTRPTLVRLVTHE